MSNTGTLATQICTSLRRSTLVLYGADLNGLTTAERDCITVGGYSNLREQGYFVQVQAIRDEDSLALSFAEDRGSDEMVLYWGRPSEFDRQCGIPDQGPYLKAERFKTEKQLAKRIEKLVKAAAKVAAKTYKGAVTKAA